MRVRFVVPQAEAGERLDKLIPNHSRLSRKRARTLIARGGAWVDGAVVKRAEAKVSAGAVVEVRTVAAPDQLPDLVERYRDAELVVVDKPSGLPSQGTSAGGRVHVHGILQAQERYAGLHHRLDTPASGLLLLTLSPDANARVADGFRLGSIKRSYLVVVVGDPGEHGLWEGELEGKTACTEWRRLAAASGMALLECRLRTGRTHQIRKHAVEAGFPVVGDRRHGGAAGRAWPRLALHAWSLSFEGGGAPQQVRSPVPSDLRALVETVTAGAADLPPDLLA